MPRTLKQPVLRQPVYLQLAETSRDDQGGVVQDWDTPLVNQPIRAQIRPLSGREYFEAAQAQAQTTHEITIRWYSGLTTKYRIKWGSRIFHIDAVITQDAGGQGEVTQYQILLCREQS